jgi:hypothetical protein
MDIFTAFGLSASAGLNAFIPLLVVSIIARFTTLIELSSPWNTLESWWVIGILIILSIVEFFADKVPAVNHINDIIQTFIRPAAGAIVFAASSNSAVVHPVLTMAAGLLIAGGVHAVKAAAVRPAITATTGGAGNIPVSIMEDVVSTFLSLAAILIPILVAAIIILCVSLIIWWLWRRANRKRRVQ